MRTDTSRKSEAFGSAKLSEKAERTLRRVYKTNTVGSLFSDDIKEHPYVLSAWMLSSAVLGSVMSVRLALKMRSSEAVRQRFKNAAEAPINPKLYEDVLKACPDTGELQVSMMALFHRQRKALGYNLNHLFEYGLDKLPKCNAVKITKSIHARLTRNPMPAMFNDSSQRRSSSMKGAIFALASMGVMEPSDIAAHLHGRDEEMYLQEYAALEV